MFRTILISLGIMVVALSACEQQVLVAAPSDHYEVVALVAE